jgi:5-methylcytosine-specific restriction endonuclease McrA
VEKVHADFVLGKNSVIHRTLIERDGEGCFYCFEEVPGLMTQEHLVARAHGGPNHISNKFRACRPCNEAAGHLSAPEKIRIREVALLRRAAEPSQNAA